MNFINKFLLFNCFLLLSLSFGCSGLEQSEQESLRKVHAQGERIHRRSDSQAYVMAPPETKERDPYPWEAGNHYPPIKIEDFVCRGSSSHPPHIDYKDPKQLAHSFDCGGKQKHSLPLRENREFIYPILIDLLNYIQQETRSKVVITSGYRCPIHNAYADSSPYNKNSKHMIGAEVDFYVQRFEERPEKIIALLLRYYEKKGAKDKAYAFSRLHQASMNVATPPWYNEEILIKLYQKEEGRDFDNQHSYPYISIQVRYDRDRKTKVIADHNTAFHCYRKY